MKKNYLAIVVLAVLFYSPLASAQLVTNGDFETGDFTGWTTADSGGGQFSVISGTTTPISGNPVPAPPSGAFASISDQDGPGSHILYQDVNLPDNGRILFSFQLYYNNRAGVWADNGTLSEQGGANQKIRVDIMDPAAPVDDLGAGVLLNVLASADGDPFEFGYEKITADLTPLAGQRVRIRFAQVDNQFFLNMGIDDVKVSQLAGVPVNHPIALLFIILGMLGVSYLRLRS